MRDSTVKASAVATWLRKKGSVGIIPTDTVYGLVARAHDREAVMRLYKLKRRERKPGTVIAANTQQLINLGIDAGLLKKVEHLWPNPISIVLPLSADLFYLHQGVGDQPFRVVADEGLRSLLGQTGPLVTSSANQPGEPVANNLAEAQAYFKDAVDFYVDGGDLSARQASTIVRLVGSSLEVLRQGALRLP